MSDCANAALTDGSGDRGHPRCLFSEGFDPEAAGRLALAPMKSDTLPTELPICIPDAFIADVLKPYRRNARYLKGAEITQFSDVATGAWPDARLVTGCGRFGIPESCYIDDTGHFNAVEFNICYNQIAYVVLGKCIEAGLMHRLRKDPRGIPTFADFKRNQLPAMLILSIESRYFKQLNSREFTGELILSKFSFARGTWFLSTKMTFADDEGVKAKGAVLLAFNPALSEPGGLAA